MRQSHHVGIQAGPLSTIRDVAQTTQRGRRVAFTLVSAFSVLTSALLISAPAGSAASSAYAVTELPFGPAFARAVAADPATGTVYVATNGPAVAVIDAATNVVTAQVSLPKNPAAIAVDSATDTVYALGTTLDTSPENPDAVYVISGATNAVTNTILLPSSFQSGALAVNPATDTVYVTDFANSSLIVINGTIDAATTTISLADPVLDPVPTPQEVSVDAATNTVYVSDDPLSDTSKDQVEVIDGATNAVTGRIALPSESPSAMAVDSAAGLLYVAESNAIAVVDTATDSVSALASGVQPGALALDAATGTLYATSIAGGSDGLGLGTTSVIDTASGAIEASIPRGGSSIAMPASGGSVYVGGSTTAGFLDQDVTVITPSTVNTMSPVIRDDALACDVGRACQVQLLGSGIPAVTFSGAGLPAWLSLSPSGLLAGTPPAGSGGNFSVSVTASNGIAPADTLAIPVTVYENPTITSANQVTFDAGVAGSFTVTASGYPESAFYETGALPAGVSFNGSTGVLSGTPAASSVGSYPIQLEAVTDIGSIAYQSFILTVGLPTATSAPPAVLNYPDGTLALYTVRSDGNIWADAQSTAGGAFSGWLPLSTSGNFAGTPAVIETSSGIIGVYARTTSGTIVGASQASPRAAASTWSQIGAASSLVSNPDVLLTASGVIAIYASDSSGAVEGVSQFARNSTFGSWQTLSPGDGFSGRPAALQTPSGVIAIYARTSAGTILGTSQHVVGGPFSAWGQLGTASDLASDPTVLRTASGVIAVYGSDTSGAVEGISQSVAYGPFGSWQALSPSDGFSGRPAVLQTSSGVIAIYARTSTGTVLGTSQHVVAGPFGPWSQLGTANDLASDPIVLITNTSHVIAVYATNSAGAIEGISQSVAYGPFGSWIQI